jgi:cell division protease FtsH
MDGFEPNTAVLIVAATNRGDLLDPALLRPGRFDRRVVLDLPDMEGRKAILAIHAKGKPFAAALDWDKVAKRTVGFSGADLENMLNEAAILAARTDKKEIDNKDIEEAATKVKLGPEKKRLQSDLDRKMTAYHEAGHAVVNYYCPNLDPVHRVSIVSRGMALGYTMAPPEKDRLHETKSRLIEEIAMTMGGRAAEQLIFKEMTSGAANDIGQATRIARYMVMEFGMSDLGPINFGPHMDITEWGKQYMEQNTVSQEMQGKIDAEVKKFLDEGYRKACDLLRKHKGKLDEVAAELVKRETLEGDDFASLMGGLKTRIQGSN